MILPVDTNIFPYRSGVYVVGGSVRDLLAGRDPADYDMAVSGDPDNFASSMAAKTGGHVVEIGKHGHTILRVVTKDIYFDILPLNGGSIEEDLRRRDFTLNAMALDLSSGDLIDPLNGRRDMADGLIRMVSDDVFRRDPVRLVRAYRMAAAFDFRLAATTESIIYRDAERIRESAGERIREELFKIFRSNRSHTQITQMAHSGLLFCIFPELLPLKTCQSSGRKSTTDLDQTLVAYGNFEKLLDLRLPTLSKPADRVIKDLDIERSAVLKSAILLHRIGGPVVRRRSSLKRAEFYGYAAKSAAMARFICKRLRCSKRQSDNIGFIIRHHRRPFFLFKAHQKNSSTDRGFIRFFMKCGKLTPDILLHALALFVDRIPEDRSEDPTFAQFVAESLGNYYAILQPRSSRPMPITGHDLIRDFKLKPSSGFKRILRSIEEEKLARSNLTRDQALELVTNRLQEVKIEGSP
jgi:tRNA nucleotidyltransferase/poly(A) polymerase